MKKIFISLILTLSIVFAAFGIVSAETPQYLKNGDEYYQWSFNSKTGELSVSPAYVDPGTRTTSVTSAASDATTLTINGIHFSNRPKLGYAYYGNLADLKNIQNINVNSICNNLTVTSAWKNLKSLSFKNNTAKKTVIDLSSRSTEYAIPTLTYDKNSTADYFLDFSHISGNSVTIPASYGSDPHITYSFYNAYSLKSVSFASGTKTIPENAFDSCSQLKTVTIPSGVTTIESGAFNKCTNLYSISIPASVKTIRCNAFYKSKLQTINYAGTRDQWAGVVKTLDSDGKAIEGGNVLYLDKATVHCTDGDIVIKKTGSDNHYEYSQVYLGWFKKDGKWYYYTSGGNLVRDKRMTIDNETYCFDSDGAMVTGWYNSGSYWFFFDLKSGKMVVNNWVNYNGNWYYLDSVGFMATGSRTIDGRQYLFTESGAMFTGWIKESNEWHYYNTHGRVIGWEKIGNYWYYFEERRGGMVTGHQNIDGHWYMFRASGVMHTGWYQSNSNSIWSYYDASGMQAFGWKEINGKKYYFNGNGNMLSGGKYTLDGKTYKFLDDGSLDESWTGN